MIHERRIDFNQLAKPANLQNSAVLRMLEEEEERKRAGKAGLKRVAWPPPPEDQDIEFIEQGPVQVKTRGVGEYASYQSQSKSPSLAEESSPVPPAVVSPRVDTPPRQQQQQQQQQPAPKLGLRQPSQFQQQQQQPPAPRSWAPVPAPSSPQPQQLPLEAAPLWERPSVLQPEPQLIIASQDHQSPQSFKQPHSTAVPHFEPPPSIITLRPEPPISQAPPPVFQAQPAATNPNSGSMRGDLKWPPASVKEQVEAENRARIELAKGPVCRPRRVNRDYSSFFAQHALTNNYPGYRVPPGTQYFTPAYQH